VAGRDCRAEALSGDSPAEVRAKAGESRTPNPGFCYDAQLSYRSRGYSFEV